MKTSLHLILDCRKPHMRFFWRRHGLRIMERLTPGGLSFLTPHMIKARTVINVSSPLLLQRGGQDTESAKAKEERDEEGGERELGPGKDAEFRESQETMRWQEMKNL